MILKSISYSEFVGGSHEWVLEQFTLGPINLLVGKNATGKSRCLNVINGLALLLSKNRQLFISGSYDVKFEDDNGSKKIQYILELKNSKVVHESFIEDEQVLLTRGQGGAGEIFVTELGKKLNFQAPETSLAVVARQDKIQHPFLECLSTWSNRVIRYEFGSPLGRDHYAVLKNDMTSHFDPRKTSEVITIFKKGEKDIGKKFIDSIKDDMKRAQYHITDVGVKKPVKIAFPNQIEGEPVGLYVKEADLPGITEQANISQGMFRVLSLIIQINYCHMTDKPSCMLIDDIGEGLDFERSILLIMLLMEKAEMGQVQLVMSTNDRFVMNKVPLETWCVLKRQANKCKVYNYKNSKEIFDNFKYTGMNNFDFFVSDFIEEGLSKDE